jgi:Flp pilus assembly protein TadB
VSGASHSAAPAAATDVSSARQRRRGAGRGVADADPAALVEVRAALAAGAAPVAALSAVQTGPLASVAAAARLGRPLGELAAEVTTGDARADLLVRALAVAEANGAGGVAGVDQALAAGAEDEAVRRALRVRSTQARLTAVLLTAMPALLWVLFVATNPGMLGFYRHPAGAATGVAAGGLGALGQWWARRIVTGAARAVAAADPIVPPAPRRDLLRVVALGGPPLVGGLLGLHPGLTLPAAALGALLGWRGTRADRSARLRADAAARAATAGGAAETVELLATALAAGAPPVGAVGVVAPVAPPVARGALRAAERRLRGGWGPDEAFAGTGLDALGAALAATTRWGAPAEDALRRLAAELRAGRRAAAEEAAERVQIALVFPTTLLTLPAFVLAVVPPLVWTAFAG